MTNGLKALEVLGAVNRARGALAAYEAIQSPQLAKPRVRKMGQGKWGNASSDRRALRPSNEQCQWYGPSQKTADCKSTKNR